MAQDAELDLQLQAAVRSSVESWVPELIAEARQEAEAEVKRRLVDVMAAETLHEALRELQAGQRPGGAEAALAAGSPPAPDSPPAGANLYAYCVVKADLDERALAGLTAMEPSFPPRLIKQGRLAAVVSLVPRRDFDEEPLRSHLDDVEWLAGAAQRHERLLEQLGNQATIMPLRMCTIFRAESGVREMLLRETRTLNDALDHLDGRSEWGVRVLAGASVPPSDAGWLAARDSELLVPRPSERDGCLGRQEELLQAAEVIHEQLSRAAVESARLPAGSGALSDQGEELLLNGTYLVDDAELPHFLALTEALRYEHEHRGLSVEPTGPWPAYNFVPGGIAATW